MLYLVKIGQYNYWMNENDQFLKRRGKGFIKPLLDKDGYLKLALTQNDVTYNIFLHKAIWNIYKGDVPEGFTIDHIDNDKLNNKIDNLQLLSSRDNVIKGNAKTWVVTTPEGKSLEVYNLEAFCKIYGLHAGHMREVSKGVISQSKGWKCHVKSY